MKVLPSCTCAAACAAACAASCHPAPELLSAYRSTINIWRPPQYRHLTLDAQQFDGYGSCTEAILEAQLRSTVLNTSGYGAVVHGAGATLSRHVPHRALSAVREHGDIASGAIARARERTGRGGSGRRSARGSRRGEVLVLGCLERVWPLRCIARQAPLDERLGALAHRRLGVELECRGVEQEALRCDCFLRLVGVERPAAVQHLVKYNSCTRCAP